MPTANPPMPFLLKDEIINGLMLSDAYISNPKINEGNARIEITQTPKRIEFLNYLAEYFFDIGLGSNLRRIIHWNKQKQKHYVTMHLSTSKNPTITKLRNYWYPNKNKIVPKDFKLTHKSLAYWFMGDGHSSWHNEGKSIDLQLATYSFESESMNVLKNQLKRFNLKFNIIQRSKGYLMFRTADQKNNERFMNLVEPYILPCFQYKIKHINKFMNLTVLK